MTRSLSTDLGASWRRRFEVPVTYTQVARAARGRGLAASNRSGVFQIYAWDVASGAMTRLTQEPKGRVSAVLGPDGRHAYFLKDSDGDELGHWVRVATEGGAPEDLTPDLPPYAGWSIGHSLDNRRAAYLVVDQAGFHLYAQDIAADGALGAPRRLAGFTKLALGATLSPDGALVVVGSGERFEAPRFSLVAFDAASGAWVRDLYDGPAASIQPVGFAPVPGATLLLATSSRSGVNRPLIWDVASGERHDLALDELEGEVQAWDWSPDGAEVLLCHVSQAVQRLYIYEVAARRLRRLDHPGGTFDSAYFADGDTIFAHWQDAVSPPQLIALAARTGARRRTIIPPGEAPPSRPWRSVSFASADGTPIQAWLATPAGDGPFPTILETHGGPTSVTMESYSPPAQMWLDHGFAYMSVNYRGSTTFGKQFEEQIYGDLGRLEVEDMAAAREWLLREGIAQPGAILLTGWSYGGYLTLMGLGTRPELWAGGMAGIAIADWTVQYEDTAPTLRGYQVALFGGTPAEIPEQYARSSPISYVDQVRAPVLVIQGRNDTRCPARPMEEYERRLRERGGQIEVEWFDAGHGSYETAQRIAHYELMLRFAHRVLG